MKKYLILFILLASCNSSKRIVDKERKAVDVDIEARIDSLVTTRLKEVNKWAKLNLNVTPYGESDFEVEFTESGIKGTGVRNVTLTNEEGEKKTEQEESTRLNRSKKENMKIDTNIKKTLRKSNRIPIILVIGVVIIVLFALYFRRNILNVFKK